MDGFASLWGMACKLLLAAPRLAHSGVFTAHVAPGALPPEFILGPAARFLLYCILFTALLLTCCVIFIYKFINEYANNSIIEYLIMLFPSQGT
jgi:hypothetical protein